MDDTTSEGSSVMEEEVNQIEELFTAIMQATDADNRSLSSPFTLLPSKKVILFNIYEVNSVFKIFINFFAAIP